MDSDLKQIAKGIFHKTLAAIDIAATMRRKLERQGSRLLVNGETLDLSAFERILVIAVGKASVPMAHGLADLLVPDFSIEGIVVTSHVTSHVVSSHVTSHVVTPHGPAEVPSGLHLIVAGHPLPDVRSFAAGRAILNLLATANERTLVFFLLSGGGSALIEQPLDPALTVEDIEELNESLIACGGSIVEINAVRKHFSGVKGGRLAMAAPDAMKVTLGIMDVPDECESALASGPTLPDPTTAADACRVIHRYGLLAKLPAPIRARLERPETIPETPKGAEPAFRRSIFSILLGRHDLFHPAHHAAEAAGFLTVCDNTTDDWPVERAADYLLTQLDTLKRVNPDRPAAIIADGEVSCPVTGTGLGGRNSAFVLQCAERIAGREIAVLSAGTDGIDGSSPAAGAVADGETFARARSMGLDPEDYFLRSDSYTFFHELHDAIQTGPTGNNLRDLRILLAK